MDAGLVIMRSVILVPTILGLFTGCSVSAPGDSDTDPDSDSEVDTDADSDIDTAECTVGDGDTVPVEFQTLDMETGCLSAKFEEQLDADYWYDWAYNVHCVGECMDMAFAALDATGRCLVFNNLCTNGTLYEDDPWYVGCGDPETDPPCCQMLDEAHHCP